MLVLFIILSVTSVVKYWFLGDPLTGNFHVYSYLGITKYTWSMLHDVSGMLLLITITIHIILHLKWMYLTTKSFFRKGKKHGK